MSRRARLTRTVVLLVGAALVAYAMLTGGSDWVTALWAGTLSVAFLLVAAGASGELVDIYWPARGRHRRWR